MSDRPHGRRLLRSPGSWEEIRADFRWPITPSFNLAHALCDSWASLEPERIALVHIRRQGDVEHWSYARLKEASDRLAAAFVSTGVRRGDRVAQILGQGPEALITHFALLKIGAISVPIAMLLGEDAVVYRARDCQVRGIVCDDAVLDLILALRPQLPELKLVWTNGAARPPVRAFWDDIASAQPMRSFARTGPEDPAFILYTSGTTGLPKGVVHAHRVLLGHLPGIELHHASFPQPGDLAWTPADWTWIGTLMAALPCLWYGVSLVSHKLGRFDPEEAWRFMVAHGIRNMACAPSALRVLRVLRETPVPKDHRLRSIGTGGERLDAEMHDWCREAVSVDLSESYGLTECNIAIATCPGLMEIRRGSFGLAVPGFDVAVIDDAGQELPPDTMGEIAIAAPNPSMFLRYWNDPEATAAAFTGRWFKTGDLGTREADGYFRYASRSDDLIKTSGYRLGPGEIEAVVNSHPAVRGSAVVGLPDPVRTEVVAAFVCLAPSGSAAGLAEQLADLVRRKIGPHAVPRRVEIVEALPLTATGKINRRAIRDGWPGSTRRSA